MTQGKDLAEQVLSLITRVLLILTLLLPLASCKEKPCPAPPPPTVTVIHPVEKSVSDDLHLTGNTQAINTVQLRARVAGYLEKIFFQDGQFVKKDELLFLIQQDTYQDSLRQAEAAIVLQKAQLAYASAQFVRYTELLARKAAAQSDVDNWRYQRDAAQANLASAEANRDLAKLNLVYTEVRAPFDGRVDRRLVDPGNLVGSSEATVLATINQISPLYTYFTISESDLGKLLGEGHFTPGRTYTQKWPVFMGTLNEEGYPHEGLIDFASISLTPTTGTLQMRGIFSNPDGRIMAGTYARLRVPVREMKALLVPQQALGVDQRGPYVLVMNGQNVVERRDIKMGSLVEHMRIIEEGLTREDWVVVRGLQKAFPGRPVTPEKLSVLPPPQLDSRAPEAPL